MTDTYATALGASRVLLRIARALNLLVALLALLFLAASFPFEPAMLEFFTKVPARADPALLMGTLRVWLALALPALAATHVLISRLMAIVDTVRAGDPFVPENAARMTTIAWCLLVIELFGLLSGVMAATMNAAGSRIPWSFSAAGWVAVALLFVLARVFEEGTRMRGELEEMV
jgi:hypothetical protein